MRNLARLPKSRFDTFRSNETRIAALAHEIRSPLSSIILMAQCELRNTKHDSQQALALILAEARRVSSIIEGTVQLARGHASSKFACNLNDVVGGALASARRYADFSRHVCVLDLADSLPAVSINETGIEQVLVNLIRNAAEAGDSIDRGVHIVVRTMSVLEGVEISVCDDGPGIPADRVARLFSPFATTKKADPGCHGLGLSVCKRIIEEHGGQILANAALGGGAVFTIRLPGSGNGQKNMKFEKGHDESVREPAATQCDMRCAKSPHNVVRRTEPSARHKR